MTHHHAAVMDLLVVLSLPEPTEAAAILQAPVAVTTPHPVMGVVTIHPHLVTVSVPPLLVEVVEVANHTMVVVAAAHLQRPTNTHPRAVEDTEAVMTTRPPGATMTTHMPEVPMEEEVEVAEGIMMNPTEGVR
jgi:hypothetical protein